MLYTVARSCEEKIHPEPEQLPLWDLTQGCQVVLAFNPDNCMNHERSLLYYYYYYSTTSPIQVRSTAFGNPTNRKNPLPYLKSTPGHVILNQGYSSKVCEGPATLDSRPEYHDCKPTVAF